MADSSEGLNPTPHDTTARQTLAQLRVRWGSHVAPGVPEFVEINGMQPEMWLRNNDGRKGEATTYSLEREWKPGEPE